MSLNEDVDQAQQQGASTDLNSASGVQESGTSSATTPPPPPQQMVPVVVDMGSDDGGWRHAVRLYAAHDWCSWRWWAGSSLLHAS